MPDLNREFWLVILRSWDMETINVLAEYADECERSVSWNHDA